MKNNQMNKRFARALMRNPMKTKCPACGATELLTVFPDQFCMECDWDSVQAYVASGRMNDLNQAYFEHFILPKVLEVEPEGQKHIARKAGQS